MGPFFGPDPKTLQMMSALSGLGGQQPRGASGSFDQFGVTGSWGPEAPANLVGVEQMPQLQQPAPAGLDPQRASALQEWLNRGRSALGRMDEIQVGIGKALDAKARTEAKGYGAMAETQRAANEQAGALVGRQEAIRDSTIADLQTKQKARADAQQEVETDLSDLQIAARYPYAEGDAEQIKKKVAEYDRIIADENSTENQRRAAEGAKARMQEPDPNRIYKGSIGRKIGAAIALALGAYGAALTKTPNYAMQILNDAIERDIAAQRDRAARKKEAYQEGRNRYADLLAKGRSEEQAFWALKSFEWSSVADLIDSKMQFVQGEKELNNLMFMGQQSRENAELAKQNALLETQRLKLSGAVQLGGLAAEKDKLDAAKMRAGAAVPTSNLLIRTGPEPYDGAHKDAVKRAQAYLGAKRALDRVRELREELTNVSGDKNKVEVWGRIKAAHGSLQDAMRKVVDTGAALSQTEIDIMNRQIGEDPTDIAPMGAKYDEMDSAFDTQVKIALDGLNVDINPEAFKKHGVRPKAQSTVFETAEDF